MGTFMPTPHSPQHALPDFAPDSPPQHAPLSLNATSYPNGVTMDPDSQYSHLDFRPSLDFSDAPPMTTTANGNRNSHMSHGSTHRLPAGPGRHRNTMSMAAFDGPRSPPNAKNTSHVPCKFYRQGQCQAGKACPFSHDLNISTDEVCRYFQKGNCKFGQKCALAHYLPDGKRVNRPNVPARGSMDLGGRIDPQLYRQSDPSINPSLLAQQANGAPDTFSTPIPPYPHNGHPQPMPPSHGYDMLPAIDTEFASPHYGSPIEGARNAFPSSGHLGVLDAPLPASFDSQGVSYIARHGPVAASVPSKFGFEFSSPPNSNPHRPVAPSDMSSGFKSSLAAQRNARPKPTDLASSPLTSGDEGPPQRMMHSQRVTKPKMLSSSLPRVGIHAGDWDEGFHFSEGEETDYIPTSLHDQILTPQEKMRRLSRNEQDNRSVRDSLSGIGTPVGSPNTQGSPSRYGAFFARRQQQDTSSNHGSSPSAFGPVGSPLRNLHPGASPSLQATTKEPAELSPPFPSFASPPRQSSMSMLSQQLGRTRISSKQSDGSDTSSMGGGNLHPASARHTSAPGQTFNRSLSSSAYRERIEEEQGVFPMEEEDDDRSKRLSGGHPHAWGAVGSKRADWT